MKKISAIFTIAILVCLLFAFSINADETKGANGIYSSTSNEYGTVNIIDGYDYSPKLSLEQRMVLDNGDGTYSTYPSAYALNYNNDKSKRGERFQHFDPSILNDETGYTYSHASVIRYEIPEGITIIHHDDRININFNTCDNLIEVIFPASLTFFSKGDFLNGMDSLITADMSKCTGLKSFGGSTFANSPALKTVILPPVLTSVPNNSFQASGIENITIPQSVTSVGQYAFYNCKSLKTVTMYDSVTSLGQKVFQYSTLEEFVVPAGVTSIPQDCFHGCTSLKTVTMGDNVTSMAGYVFNGCSALTSLTLSDNITAINSYSIAGCTSLTEITLPSKLTSVSACMFRGCTALKGIVVPSTVTSIGNQAFYNCYALESISLNEGLQSTGNEAFGFCKVLTEITFPSTLTTVGQYGFNGCAALSSVIFSDGTTVNHELVGVFQSCSSLATVKLPSGITGIGYNCFYKCSKLTTLVGGIPSTVTRFDRNSFHSCTILADLGTLPAGLTYIGQDAFNACKALASVTLPDGIETIFDYAFTQCSGLTSINIPDSVTYLGKYAFNTCSSLATVTISENSKITGEFTGVFQSCPALTGFILPRGITSIGDNSFKGCKAITTIGGAIPSGVTLIGKDCFNGCALLTEFVLPQGLITIRDYAFTNCAGLLSVNIPDTVTYLGYYAFNGCSALTTVSISENSQISGTWRAPFNNCKALTSIYVPAGVTKFEYDVFSYCNALTSITFGEGLVEITSGNNFRNCSSLKFIKLPNTLTTIADNNFGGCTALEEIRLGDSLTHLGAGNLTFKALKRVYIPASLTSVGTHLLGYTNSADSSQNITFIFTGTYAQAQALRALVKEDTANVNNASKLYDAKLVPSNEYDVTQEPSGYHFVYNYSKCEAFYDSHSLTEYNSCVDKCTICLHLYAVSSPVHNFEGGEAIVYEDFAKAGIKTIVCQNEGCKSNDGSSQSVAPIFTFYGYSIYEFGTSFCVNYTIDIEALETYEQTNGVTLDFGLVGAYVGYLNGGAPLDPTNAKPVDISSTGNRIFCHSIRRMAQANAYMRLINIAKEQYEEEFYICLYIFDGKEVKYLTADYSTSIPDPVSYAEVRGPVDVKMDNGKTYSTEQETTQDQYRLDQIDASKASYNTGTTLTDEELYGTGGWFGTKGVVDKANNVINGGGLLGYDNAAALMEHFLANTGEDYILDMDEFLADPKGVTLSNRNNDINNMLRAAELLAVEGQSLTINQTTENVYNNLQDDWYYAMGGYYTDVDMLNLTVTIAEDGTKIYSGTIRYSVTDCYDWDERKTSPLINNSTINKIYPTPSQYELRQLHKAGIAREFITYGEITYENVTWTEGQTVADLGI